MAEHYYDEKQTSEFKPKKIKIAVAGVEFEIYTAAGVFSTDQLDRGTKVLIDKSLVPDNAKVLDLGCGYGVVGVAIKKLHPSAEIFMSDTNSRAVRLSKMNSELNKTGATVLQGDSFSNKELAKLEFDTILLNPPQSAGKEVCFKLIDESKEHLVKNGLLQIVARPNKGGTTLMKKMQETFGNAREIARKSGYAVYVSAKE